ncbi:hypothetical protein N399_19740 [Bacillus licheniformis CG-B52]|nr:hypothetical protein N399_19740 [Bacillus licheniformis CG-B52]KUL12099.1 hypothetical protein LI17339_07345 [Bacillus licheniformis LMG 17339]
MNWELKQRYRYLREQRRERDYELGLIQLAGRPFCKPRLVRLGPALTLSRFMAGARR